MSGRWERTGQEWWETSVINCALCGQMIPCDAWVVDDDAGGRRLFCSPECERLYGEYWLPRYGPAGRRAS